MATLGDFIAQLAAEGRLLPRTPPTGPAPGRPVTPGVDIPVRPPIEDRKPPRPPIDVPDDHEPGRPIDPPPDTELPTRPPIGERPADPEPPEIPTTPGGPTPSPLPAPDNFSKGQVRPELMPNGIFNPTLNSYGSFDPFTGAGGGSKSGGPSGGGLAPYSRGTASTWDPLGIGQSNYGGGPIGQSPSSAANVYGMTGVNAATGYQGPERYGVVGGQGGYGVGMVGPEYSGPIFNNPQSALRAMRKQEKRLNRPIQAQSLGTPAATTQQATTATGGANVNQKGGQPAGQAAQPAATTQQQGAKGGQPAATGGSLAPAPSGSHPPMAYLDVNGNPISKEAYDAWTSQWRNTLQLPYGHRVYNGPQGGFFESSETAGAPSGVYKQQGTNALHTYQGGQFVPWQQGQAVGTARPGGEVMQQFSLLGRR